MQVKKEQEIKGRTINDLGGGSAKSGKKKLNGYSPRKKKTQPNNPEQVQRLVTEEKKVQRLVADEKKNSTRILCPCPPPGH